METFAEAISILVERDSDLARVVTRYGEPTPWEREPGFASLVRIILGQQVSMASAQATFERLENLIQEVNPQKLLQLTDQELKSVGFSRQKTLYARELATAVVSKQLDLPQLEQLDDLAIRQKLVKIKGIGDWTVDMYLMTVLKRLDVFPSKDLAVAIAVKEIKQLDTRPKPQELEEIALAWQPYRAVATTILWHYYLNRA